MEPAGGTSVPGPEKSFPPVKPPRPGITDAEIATWLDRILALKDRSLRIPDVPSLLNRAQMLQPNAWAIDLAPRIIQSARRWPKSETLNRVRTMIRLAIAAGHLRESNQLKVLLAELSDERWQYFHATQR